MNKLKRRKYNLIILSFIIIISFSIYVIEFVNHMKSKNLNLNYNAHIFYYNWYGNPKFDKSFRHWNHDILPHWSDNSWNNLPSYDGYETIGSNFYPKLGTYSSNDPDIIKKHMEMISEAGVGTVSVSWWGQNTFEDNSIQIIMDIADNFNIKITFHIEPFVNRTASSTIDAIKYIIDKYGNHNAFYRYEEKPLFYIYDSYLIPKKDWGNFLNDNGENSIRKTHYNSFFIGLWVEERDSIFFNESGFDGFYTYFASDGFTFGSTSENWGYLSTWANENSKIFIPCIGPGYNDERVRPWNKKNFKDRESGLYYDRLFKTALFSKPKIIGITSFNEWHEGTQVEPAIPKETKNFIFDDYGNMEPEYYLKRTKFWLEKY